MRLAGGVPRLIETAVVIAHAASDQAGRREPLLSPKRCDPGRHALISAVVLERALGYAPSRIAATVDNTAGFSTTAGRPCAAVVRLTSRAAAVVMSLRALRSNAFIIVTGWSSEPKVHRPRT